MKTRIFAFSRSTKDTYEKIKDQAENITEHLIKVFLWPNVQEVNHWKKEIYASLYRSPKLKTNNKFPKYEALMYCTWDTTEDVIYEWSQGIMNGMVETPIQFEYPYLRSAIHDYYDWLCRNLSSTGLVTPKGVYSKIEELQGKYF